MINFRTETQGTDTYIVCEIPEGVQVDTVGLGMLCNNKIRGLAPLSTVTLDNKEYLRYNISSHITLDKLFYNKTDKKRFLAVLKNILTTIRDMQDYMLEPGLLLLSQKQIYVNVGSLQTAMLYYPILEAGKEFSLKNFLRELIMTMEFDSSEDSSYVAKLINYLNKSAEISVEGLQEYINTLTYNTNSNVSSAQHNINPVIVEAQSSGYGQIQAQPGYGREEYYQSNPRINSQQNQNIPVMPDMMPSNQPPVSMPPNMNGSSAPAEEPPKKKGLFESIINREKKPVEKKEKTKKEKKGKAGNQKIETPAGIVIPGMENAKNSSLPIPPQAPGASMKATSNQQASIVSPSMQQAPMTPPPIQQTPMTPTSMQQAPMTPPPMQQAPMTPTSQMQRAQMASPMLNQQPMTEPIYRQPAPIGPDYGHTVILEDDDYSKGTMILMDDFEPNAGRRKAYLIRKKTNERIEITKDVFRIGKERDFVDYWVSNNSAVSRSHADIIYQDGNYYIMDNNSLNHTYVNDQQIASQQMVKLEEFSRIKLANEYFEFQL